MEWKPFAREKTGQIFLGWLLSAAAPAYAQDAVLWYAGNYGYGGPWAVIGTRDALADAGASRFEDTYDWPSDLSDYKLIFLSLPNIDFDAEQLAQIED